MSKMLELDNDYEEVQCPKCGHNWYAAKVQSRLEIFNKTIRCPECKAPLKPPVADMVDMRS